MRLVLLCSAAALFFACPAQAQSTSRPALGATQSNSGGLEEIVVTAQKRAENLQDTPIAVTAVTLETIRERGLSNASELTGIAPSITVAPGASSTTNITVFIRGVGDSEQVLTSDSPVGLYVDGVVIGRSAGAAFDILDLERVEVLRGPQGTLYGRNTIGGAVNLITGKPADEPGFSGGFSVGNYDLRQGKVSLETGDIGGSGLSARLTYLHKQRSGYVNNPNQPDRRDPGALNLNAGRAALQFQRDALTVDYDVDYSVRQSYSAALQITTIRPDLLTYLSASLQLGGSAPVFSPTRLGDVGRSPAGRITDRVQGHTLRAEYDLDGTTLRSLTGYRSWHGINRPDAVISNTGLVGFTVGPEILAPPFTFNPRGVTPVNLFTAQNNRKQHQWSEEINVLGNIGSRFKYVVGGYYFDEHARETNPTSFLYFIPSPVPIPLTSQVSVNGFGVQIPALLQYRHHSRSKAMFAQGTYALTEDTNLTGGIRYTRDDKRLVQVSPYVRELSANFSKVNYAISLDQKVTRDILAYARVSTGYKAGGFNARSGNNGYKPESLISCVAPHLRKEGEIGELDVFDRQLGVRGMDRAPLRGELLYDLHVLLRPLDAGVSRVGGLLRSGPWEHRFPLAHRAKLRVLT